MRYDFQIGKGFTHLHSVCICVLLCSFTHYFHVFTQPSFAISKNSPVFVQFEDQPWCRHTNCCFLRISALQGRYGWTRSTNNMAQMVLSPTTSHLQSTKDDKSTYESYEQISGMSRYERHRASLCSAELFTFHMFSIVLACLGHGQARPSDAKHHNHKAKNERPAQRSLGRLRWRSGIKVGKLLQHGVRIIAQPSQADIFKRLHSSIL